MLQFPTWKRILVAVICALGVLYAVPNLLDTNTAAKFEAWTPSWGPGRQVNLGLDLRGGAYLLLEVETDIVVRERLEAVVDTVRGTLNDSKIGYKPPPHVVGRDAVSFAILDVARTEEVRRLLGAVDSGLAIEAGEGGAFTLKLSETEIAQMRRNALQQSIEIVRRRIDETGTKEPLIQRQGDDRILLQLPGEDNPDRVKDLIGQTAKLTFRFVDDSVPVEEALKGKIPPGSELLPSAERYASHYLVKKRVMVSGENLVDAQPSFDENSQPAVSFRFDTLGARKFGKATQENVGKLFAIVLDNKVISAPRIRTAILGGSGIITGSFTTESARDLALLLRAGALPAPVSVIEERTVGPGLGHDSIEAGKIASIVGFIMVIGFMIAAYGLFGVFASVALVFNVSLILGILTMLQATLTLPGIAGIVLTMGMAVDANVLIFERMREEVRNGRSILSAVHAGHDRAMVTIIDSNLTTLVPAMLLYTFGSGPIKGFAVTLSVGLITSMFTAIMLTHLIIILWLRRYRPTALPI